MKRVHNTFRQKSLVISKTVFGEMNTPRFFGIFSLPHRPLKTKHPIIPPQNGIP